jgi:ribosomal protein L25 (general stress protein Ctc)
LNIKAGNACGRAQLVPGVMYGRDYAPKALQFEYLPLHRAVLKAKHQPIESLLAVEGEAEPHKGVGS